VRYIYDRNELLKFINENYNNIKPRDVNEKSPDKIFPKIWDQMSKFYQKEIMEMLYVYEDEQWTATTLMACRILESALRLHVQENLDVSETRNIREAIKIMEKNDYGEAFLNRLNELKEERNSYMHGLKRAGSADAKEMINYVLSIFLQIFNMRT
jgi:ADP-ribosylglycohydrolase